jgi:hypothetical protein
MYVDSLGQHLPTPTVAQALAFFNDNPSLFGEPGVYSTDEIKVAAGPRATALRQTLAPVTYAQARDAIHMMLRHRAHGVAVQAAMSRLRAAARIEIMGDAPIQRPLVLAWSESRP